MPPFVNGLLFGLIFVFSLGPGFFALIQTSIQQGIKPAFFTALGISLSDALYVSLALLGISALLEDPDIRYWMAVFGTLMLFSYALYSWFKPPKVKTTKPSDYSRLRSLRFIGKGFLLNGLNPFILVFWISIISVVSVRFDYSGGEERYFFVGVLVTIFTMDVIKIFLSRRLKYMITPSRIVLMNRFVSVILTLFGIRILFFLYDNYWMI